MPVTLYLEDAPDDGVPKISAVVKLLRDNGSVQFPHSIPEGTKLGVGVLTMVDVESSAQACIGRILREIASETRGDYKYEALFCVSCVARYVMMAGVGNREALILKKSVPNELVYSGYYGFGEICPTRDNRSGAMVNRAHGMSFAICAL
jgi:hypothetical protein